LMVRMVIILPMAAMIPAATPAEIPEVAITSYLILLFHQF
jgi:hypothetical protein